MAESESSIKKAVTVIHSAFTIAWLTFSTCMSGIMVIVFSLFNNRLIYWVAKFWAANLLFSAGIRVRTYGLDKLQKGEQYVFVANHQSVYDIPALYFTLPFRISFLTKKELYSIPFFGRVLYSSGNICIDRSNARKARESITSAVKRLKSQKASLVLFPEGTRSPDGKIGVFKSASFALALEARIKVVPIYISGSFQILRKNSLLVRPGTILCKIADPIEISNMRDITKSQLSERTRTVLVEMQEKRTHSNL